MIAQSPQEREKYEARLKFERDQIWRIKAAKDEGRAEGIESTTSEPAELELEQLSSLATRLQEQLRDRR